MRGNSTAGAKDSATERTAAAARARWPGIGLGDAEFARHVQALGVSQQDLAARGEELYLAGACARGDAAALRVLESEYLCHVGRYVGARLKIDDELTDEVRQAVRIKLLLDRPPRIARYDGSGPLGAWIRVASVRVALDVLRATKRAPPVLDAEELATPLAGPRETEGELARLAHGPQFQAAMEQALSRLRDRDKAILRFHFVEGLSLDAIGTLYRVHRVTVFRWLAEIRAQLLKDIQRRLALDLRVSPSEFRSLLGLVRDELRVSISRLLRKD